jgi:hypothetical protein
VGTFYTAGAATPPTALLGLSKDISDDELKALQKAIDQAKERQG